MSQRHGVRYQALRLSAMLECGRISTAKTTDTYPSAYGSWPSKRDWGGTQFVRRYTNSLTRGSCALASQVIWGKTDWASARSGRLLIKVVRMDRRPTPTDPGNLSQKQNPVPNLDQSDSIMGTGTVRQCPSRGSPCPRIDTKRTATDDHPVPISGTYLHLAIGGVFQTRDQ